MKNYVGVIKFKSKLPYEEIDGFRYDTGTENMDEAKDILNALGAKLSISNNCQVRWEFEGIGQGHYCDDFENSFNNSEDDKRQISEEEFYKKQQKEFCESQNNSEFGVDDDTEMNIRMEQDEDDWELEQ
ncbi:hypothetical protein ACF3M2_13875 [Tissierella carlieri]|uniref:hypothetical protein n=1 Tax=Tissierella TaxID=41273 RepID=UPI00303A9021